MKKVIIDTNCLLSFVTDRNLAQQEKFSKLFQEAAQLKAVILCPHHVISEFVFVLSSVYGTSAEKIHAILSDLVVTDAKIPLDSQRKRFKLTKIGQQSAVISEKHSHLKRHLNNVDCSRLRSLPSGCAGESGPASGTDAQLIFMNWAAIF
ncbi:MAG: hypothetical protein ACTFAK_11805 [Candidatus Electronema sp. VV]